MTDPEVTDPEGADRQVRDREMRDREMRDRGTATAELAVALPAVVVVLAGVLAVGQAVLAQVQCVDAARAGARAAARGDSAAEVSSLAREGAGDVSVTVERQGKLVAVSVSRRLTLLGGPVVQVQGRAVAQAEEPAATDQGSATILVLSICLLAMVLATAVAATGSAIVARHRAQAAADLGALAAADVLVGRATGEPCAAAARVAFAQGASVTHCEVSGTDVLVRAAVEPRGPAAALGVAVAAARAGPGQP